MKFKIQHNKEKSIGLHFESEIPEHLLDYLKELGFRDYKYAPLKLFAKDRPSYHQFIKDFQNAIQNDLPWDRIVIHPSYEPSNDHITDDKFSKVQLLFKDASKKKKEYVVFEPLIPLATKIAEQFSEIHFKEELRKINIYPKNYKADSRDLFYNGRIILSADSYKTDPIAIEKTAVETLKEPIEENAVIITQTKEEDHQPTTKIPNQETEKQFVKKSKEKKQTLWEYTIPIAKKLKYRAKISIAQLENGSYSYGLSYQKNFGNFSGNSGSPSIYDPQFPTHKKALKAGFVSLINKVEMVIENGDAILNNDPLHKKRLEAVGISIQAFAKEKNIELAQTDTHPKEKKTPLKKEVSNEKQGITETKSTRVVSQLYKEYTRKKQANGYGVVQRVIQKLHLALDELQDDKELAQRLIEALLDASESDNLQQEVGLAVDQFRKHYKESISDTITFQVLVLIEFFRLATLKEENTPAIRTKTIQEETLENMMVPEGIGEHFTYGAINFSMRDLIKRDYPYLRSISDSNLETADATSLFELMQFAHPTDYGIDVSRSTLLRHFEKQGEVIFKELELPIALNYPYVNIYTHHRAVRPLGEIISSTSDKKQWWHAVEGYRPVKDVEFALSLIDEQITNEQEAQKTLINPKTGKPKGATKEAYQNINWTITLLKQSRNHVVQYIESRSSSNPSEQREPKKEDTSYLDQVVAIMHTHYHKEERLSKKKVEALMETTAAPTLGMLWEAVELSWLLWYRQLYLQITPFEASLKAMIRFWTTVQPTYAYSDSSKEKYKQYSTPCLIGAMLAEYTGMRSAKAIFEPSAGNGLLLVGAKPHKTITNEIDATRRASLQFQRFSEVHALNASKPFPKKWKHHFDVMVTNPPFAKWEDDRFDKNRIVNKYFNKHYELASFMRLEHLMAGLALDTLKDTGKSGIIIMGHFIYGEDGHIRRYAPFYKWLYRHYIVDDIINLNGFTLYNKQGAVASMMLILVGGRKNTPTAIFPTKQTHPQLEAVIDSYEALWLRIKSHLHPLKNLVEQLKIANR
ncbi:N-6 DNA methylase [Dokdonia ponticola]|uniref:N-6 DNA methylase n=1 Tax=Dokdonia ponticola TaxID=2041041 RepID=A0ABV9I392_9FLAO